MEVLHRRVASAAVATVERASNPLYRMPLFTKDRRPLVWWLLSVLVGLACVAVVARTVGLRHLERSAEVTAIHHAQVLVATVPGLPDLLQRGRLDERTVDQLRLLRRGGQVFRFKLFASDGRQILVSDDLDKPAAGLAPNGAVLGDEHGARSAHVSSVVLSGSSFIELKDGRGKKDRPPAFSEAYVPLLRDGHVMGVVEVYLDQTELKRESQIAFATIALAITLVFGALAGVGTAHWMRRLNAQRRAEERVRYLAQHDVLSGALNRASLNDELERAAWCADAGGPGFAVLCVDLDRFKEVNDGFGHAAGDEVLRQVSQRLRALLRHGDHVARLGGDEFAILQSGVGNPDDVRTLAQRVVESLAAPYDFQGHPIICGGSAGAAIYGVDSRSVDDLLHKADLALYRSKAEGRGGFSFYEARLDRHLHDRRELAHDLRQAIESDALNLHYQPLYAADGITLNGYEALARWTHPTRGAVAPAQFIPVAEETGLIEALGRWVLRRACAEAATWPDGLTVAVNLSAAQFRNETLVNTVVAALGEAGLQPERLEVEITESLLMSDTERVVRTLHALSALGVRIAMDDFGTGYSSLAYLWRFPFDKVKIDRAFTKGLAEDPKVNLVVRSIVSLAHSLRIRVNAEGVETAGQLRALQKHGCDELQGHLLGRPQPADGLVHSHPTGAPPRRPEPHDTTLAGLPTMPAPL